MSRPAHKPNSNVRFRSFARVSRSIVLHQNSWLNIEWLQTCNVRWDFACKLLRWPSLGDKRRGLFPLQKWRPRPSRFSSRSSRAVVHSYVHYANIPFAVVTDYMKLRFVAEMNHGPLYRSSTNRYVHWLTEALQFDSFSISETLMQASWLLIISS